MDRMEACFLESLGCALKGVPMTREPGLSREEWYRLFLLAGQHHVLPLVFEAVHSLPGLQDSDLLAPMKQQVRQRVFLQTRKTAEFLRLLTELEAAGVRPLVVKGIVCRSLYPRPDHRYSSDEDLLLSPAQTPLCREVFARFGLTTDFPGDSWEQVHEIPFRQSQGPLYIELHQSLFPEESGSYGHFNRFFRGADRRAVCVNISGVEVRTLGYTDHLFYLICHALKHFLHSGFGIRQVCDILMFAQAHGSSIDWPALLENCRRIRALDFTRAMFRIGFVHLGFSPEGFPRQLSESGIDELPMLEDLLHAGIYGSSSESRLHSSRITLEAMASGKENRAARNSLMLSLFPDARSMEGRYPWLKDRPWLLPAAWATRMGKYCRDSLLRKPADAADALKLGRERIALLKRYGILDD